MSSADEPTPLIILQRVRNRLIEYFETTSSDEKQLDYERNVPIANIITETICGWEDWVSTESLNEFMEPVFSRDEQVAIREFHELWEKISPEITDVRQLSQVIGTEPWERLRQGAETALRAFQTRGKFDEDEEVFPA